ncbi:MAG: 6,7-dimethyl-8-ribityllumazine synthase [Deltaproteobacteria bacterium]|jgi:6,7-dimethyl-8-ribityllumazine synthase|nr:6,7-dimethyl-8-ribityllumazine synthase [Deltaproteobacteria bacterium]
MSSEEITKVSEVSGSLDASQVRVAIVASRFNSFIVERLVDGAVDTLRRTGGSPASITIVRCPGAFELPAVARRCVDSQKFDAVICLGAVIRGSTPHFDYVAAESSKGIAQVAAQAKIPVIFGVLTTDTIEQAVERAGTKAGNKGADAAMTALEMISLFRKLGEDHVSTQR